MAEESENRYKISIWWDIENCHVPKDVDPHYIAQNLSSALQRANLAGPIEIQAFGDTTILPHVTQKALSDTGITLNHVPRGNKDAADKAILVGLLLWALDNPPPANILLISGDGDFANALHRLRLKTYSILLACPAQFVKPALTGAAKKLWFWKEIAKGQLAEPQFSGEMSHEPTVSIGAMDKFSHRSSSGFNKSITHSSVSNGYTSPQKRVSGLEAQNTGLLFRSLSLENHPNSFPGLLVSSDSKSNFYGTENTNSVSAERRIASATENNITSLFNKLNVNAVGTSHVATRSVDYGQSPYFLPSTAENKESSVARNSGIACDTTSLPRPPQSPIAPAGPMPRGPLKHIAPDNRGINNVPSLKNNVLEGRFDKTVIQHTYTASEYRYPNSIPPPSRPTPLMPPEEMAHDTSLDKVYSAMKTLERDMLAPTESNLSDCIQYWDPQHERFNLKQTLNNAAELYQVTRTQLGGGLIMFFPPEHKLPWNCVDPGNMQNTYSNEIWLELRKFLLYGERKHDFLSACTRYDAAQILKDSCGAHIKNLVVGRILNLLQQAVQEKKWLRKNVPGPGWAPLVLNQKALLDWLPANETQKGASRPSNQGNWMPVVPANVEPMPDKAAVLSKLRASLLEIIKDNTGYDLSLLMKDFELSTGISLDCQKLGVANVEELINELMDAPYLGKDNNGLQLVHLVKGNGNVASGALNDDVSDKENDVTLRQMQVVRDLKSWLSCLMTVVKDGYNISKVHQDFFRASGKDLNKEGLGLNKLPCILKQFPDVIQVAKSPAGQWVAYPAKNEVDTGGGNSRATVMLTS